jgi:GR25 family glycosyltransferase involved in LPS biosynthesis
MNDFIQTTFKKKYVINLKHRNDRYEEFKDRVSPHFDPNLIERFDAIDGKNIDISTISEDFLKTSKNKGEIGCFLSHQKIWKLIIDDSSIKNDDIILVFEDDIFLTETENFSEKFIEAVYSFENISKENKYLFLGGRFNADFKPILNRDIKYHWKKDPKDILYERVPFLPIKNMIFDRTTHVNIFTKSMASFLYKITKSREKAPSAVDKFLIWSHIRNSNDIFFYDYFPHIFYSPLDYKSDIQYK